MSKKILNKIASRISSIERKYTWGVIGVFLTLVFGIPTLISWVNPPSKQISFQVIDQEQVFKLNEDIETLKERFEKQDLLSAKKNLIQHNIVVTRIRVKNTGSKDISSEEFDPQLPWGIKLENGEIIADRIFQTSSEYIENYANPQIIDSNLYEINKVMLDKKQYLTFDLLTILNENEKPKFKPIGKVAGIEQIEFSERKRNPGEIKYDLSVFWNKVFYGDIKVHLTRAILYAMFVFFIFSILNGSQIPQQEENDHTDK